MTSVREPPKLHEIIEAFRQVLSAVGTDDEDVAEALVDLLLKRRQLLVGDLVDLGIDEVDEPNCPKDAQHCSNEQAKQYLLGGTHAMARNRDGRFGGQWNLAAECRWRLPRGSVTNPRTMAPLQLSDRVYYSRMSENLNRISRRITQEASQGASQAMLYATGLTPADMEKAQVGIASMCTKATLATCTSMICGARS